MSNTLDLPTDVQKQDFTFEPPPGGDMTLQSSDGPSFLVHSVILGLVSPELSNIFKSRDLTQEKISLDDDSESISLMLAFVYPSSVAPTIDNIETLDKSLTIARKYGIEKIVQTIDRDLSRSEATTGLIRRSSPLRFFRLAATYGLRDCQTLAARSITPRHINLLDSAEIVKLAREHPTAAHAIGLVGAQTLRVKIVSDILFTFSCGFLPKTWMSAKPGQTSNFVDSEGGQLMMCDNCASQMDDFMLYETRPFEYVPSWIYWWSRQLYSEVITGSLDDCSHLFEVSYISEVEDTVADACWNCVQAAINATPYYGGRQGAVFESWASGVRQILRKEFAKLDDLHTL
ncbi:The BTB (BR-C, ttk and bab)/POZ (Pox virus and Zinc finger) domain [Ceratobasidium sp. AG-Ba]|nr:The BTB (BR-C, ttk and bab)/POZ (Pox virus and Zinc finger) domain [Ceratobasidium sp. AG-Ba]